MVKGDHGTHIAFDTGLQLIFFTYVFLYKNRIVMENQQNRKKMRHFNSPGHAHELTFSCYHRQSYFRDNIACEMFLEEVEKSRKIYNFKLWAYVVMPHHVHMLLWPLDKNYDIGKIESGMKGIIAKRYQKYLLEFKCNTYESFIVTEGNEKQFVFWQRGGGFDRNFWNTIAIYNSINYIEANPVRSHFVALPDEWQWSSAYARTHKIGVISDVFTMPIAMPNPQYQRMGKI